MQIYGGQRWTLGIFLDCSVLYKWRQSLLLSLELSPNRWLSLLQGSPYLCLPNDGITGEPPRLPGIYVCLGIITLVLILEHQVLYLLGHTLSPSYCLFTLSLCLSNSRLILSNGERHFCTYWCKTCLNEEVFPSGQVH